VTTVLICDDRRGVREALTEVMSSVPEVGLIDGVTHDQVLVQYLRRPADLVLVGIQRAVPTGVATIRRLVAVKPRATVLACGARDNARGIAAAIVGGARGYLRWDTQDSELIAALPHPGGAGTRCATLRAARAASEQATRLSQREQQVLRGLSQGMSNGQIGRELYLSEDTVKTHVRRLYRKLGVRDRAHAVAHGFRRGLVS
jgi:DNA-binding NarL/FixJ family response regulator